MPFEQERLSNFPSVMQHLPFDLSSHRTMTSELHRSLLHKKIYIDLTIEHKLSDPHLLDELELAFCFVRITFEWNYAIHISSFQPSFDLLLVEFGIMTPDWVLYLGKLAWLTFHRFSSPRGGCGSCSSNSILKYIMSPFLPGTIKIPLELLDNTHFLASKDGSFDLIDSYGPPAVLTVVPRIATWPHTSSA